MLVWWFEKCERLMGDSLYLYYPSSTLNHDGGNIGSLTSRGLVALVGSLRATS